MAAEIVEIVSKEYGARARRCLRLPPRATARRGSKPRFGSRSSSSRCSRQREPAV